MGKFALVVIFFTHYLTGLNALIFNYPSCLDSSIKFQKSSEYITCFLDNSFKSSFVNNLII